MVQPDREQDSRRPRETEIITPGRFTEKEREILLGDGARIYSTLGETIDGQWWAQRKLGKPSFHHVFRAQKGKLHDVASRLLEVAIYPDLRKFWVPESGDKTLREQEQLVEEDAEQLRKRLGLPGITQIIPEEASTLTSLLIQHYNETGNWFLFAVKDQFTARTKNGVNRSNTLVADVGHILAGSGMVVEARSPYVGYADVKAPRVIVPANYKLAA